MTTADSEPLAPPARPIHVNAAPDDFQGNEGRGRYLLLPGSRARASAIAERFTGATVKHHARGHDLHLGQVRDGARELDVGVISTGMGCPSIDLVVSELIALGARTLLRVGTCGSLQPSVHIGDLVVPTAAVRDESTSDQYLPREFPALPSFDLLLALRSAADDSTVRTHYGAVHTKDSLYARELELGPLADSHRAYGHLLRQGGVLATEMECAHLFVLAQLGPLAAGGAVVAAGAVLSVIGDLEHPFRECEAADRAVADGIDLALRGLARFDERVAAGSSSGTP